MFFFFSPCTFPQGSCIGASSLFHPFQKISISYLDAVKKTLKELELPNVRLNESLKLELFTLFHAPSPSFRRPLRH